MHVFTHLKPQSKGKTGLGLYPDGMVELDGYVGQLLKKLDELGVADNTIVVFTTDNGAEVLSWPDGGATPFRGEKDTNWEGGWRVPCVMRWPGVIEPGRVINDICSLQDFIPTFAAANGEPDLVEKVKKGYKIGGKTYKVHLDGYNLMPFLSGKEEKSPRDGFIYWSDDGDCMAMRMGRYKIVFAEQRSTGLDVWREPLSPMRIPKFFDLRADPFERGEESFKYNDWFIENVLSPVYGAAAAHEVAGELQGIPAARQARKLQHRPGGRKADAPWRRLATDCAQQGRRSRPRTCEMTLLRISRSIGHKEIIMALKAVPKERPNILVIFGDDIGIPQISAYTRGLMGYQNAQHRPHRQRGRAVHRRLWAAKLHRRPRLLHPRPGAVPHRPADDRHARRSARHHRLDADDRRRDEDARLRHRPVRQEPPRRPGRAPADQSRLRRVLRQPLPPQRRGGAGGLLLSEGSRRSRRSTARAASSIHGQRRQG